MRHVLVSGGAMGIGKAICAAFLAADFNVTAFDINAEALEGTVKELNGEAAGKAAMAGRICDVSSAAAVARAVAASVAERGAVDVLVNNAAVALGGAPLHETGDELWDTVMATNLKSVFLLSKAVLPGMVERRSGCIVNIASTQGHLGFDGWSAYAAAKGGILSLTRQMANEYGPFGIRVNSVSPGPILTPMNERIFAERGLKERRRLEAREPAGRLGLPEEVASVVVFLAQQSASFVAGVDLRVDGGQAISTRADGCFEEDE